jgi:hypothetical protein
MLSISPADVDAIAAGRTGLGNAAWRRVATLVESRRAGALH